MKSWIERYPLVFCFMLFLAFDGSLSIFRYWYTDSRQFLFLIWNLFLACLPLMAAYLAYWLQGRQQHLFSWGMAALSILFLPNAPYILTDLFHLHYIQSSYLLWLNTLILIAYSLTGLLTFYASWWYLEHWIHQATPFKSISYSLVLALPFLTAFGIYLGRYSRFNSWDLLTAPEVLYQTIWARIATPFAHPLTWGMTFGYGTLFLVGFLCLKLIRISVLKEGQLLGTVFGDDGA